MAYLYRHIRLDKNQPFYIGISLKDDSKYKRANENFKKHRNNIWNKIVSKTDYRVEILFDNETSEFIKEKEIEFIKLYGRIDLKTGCLANLTDGGEGNKGYKPTDETRLKLSIAGKNRPPVSDETRLKLSLVAKGIARTLGYKHTEESKLKMSITQKKVGLTEAKLPRIDLQKGVRPKNFNFNGKKHTEESKLKMSEIQKNKEPTEKMLKAWKDKIGKKMTILPIHRRKIILQYDMNMNFIQELESITYTKNLGFDPSKVVCVCKNTRKSHKGFIFRYKD